MGVSIDFETNRIDTVHANAQSDLHDKYWCIIEKIDGQLFTEKLLDEFINGEKAFELELSRNVNFFINKGTYHAQLYTNIFFMKNLLILVSQNCNVVLISHQKS